MLSSQNNDTKVINGKYVMLLRKLLGAGSFASVYQGYISGKANNLIAIKMIANFRWKKTDQEKDSLKFLQREMDIQWSIDSQHVVKMIDVVKTEQNHFIILEYCDQGNLCKKLNDQPMRRLNQDQASLIFNQIVQGYKAIYMKSVIHRDLKPENILFKGGIAKIADFGFSKIVEEMDNQVTQTAVGTLMYCAPELLSGSRFSSKVDVWSAGVIFYEMLYGSPPYTDTNIQRLFKKITTQPLVFPADVQVEQDIKELIKRMLVVDPEKRIRWDDIFVQNLVECQNLLQSEMLSSTSTNCSLTDKFIKKQQDKLTNEEIIAQLADYFDYLLDTIKFVNDSVQFFFSKVPVLQISKESQLIISAASTKYIITELYSVIQVLIGKVPPMNFSISPEQMDIYKKNQEYFKMLHNFKSSYAKQDQFLRDNITQSVKKFIKSNQNAPELTKSNIAKMEDILNYKIGQDDNKIYQAYNALMKNCTLDIWNKLIANQQIPQSEVYDTCRLIMKLLQCQHPLQFKYNEFDSKQLEADLIQTSPLQLKAKVEDKIKHLLKQ